MSSNHEDAPFKVVDKRRFTESGEDKGFDIKEEKKANNLPSESNKPEVPKMSMTLFIQSLVHQAMMGMGMVAWPDSGLIKKDFSLAQQTIDILTILEEKTKGNLSKDEQDFLTTVLYQLRMAFVELNKNKPGDILLK